MIDVNYQLRSTTAKVRLFLGLMAVILITISLVDNWWFDVVDMSFVDPENSTNNAIISVHGGLFTICYPSYELLPDGSIGMLYL